MGAKVELKRGCKTRQIKPLKLHIKFDGSLGGLVADGPDANFVSQIDDLGVGQYRVILSQSFEQDIWPDSIICEGDAKAEVVALGKDRITFDVRSSAGALTDAVCYVSLMAFDHRFFY